MPNDCWNIITIKGNTAQIRAIVETAFVDVPQWAVQIQSIGVEALQFRLWSRNNPVIDFLNNLWDTYPNIWIKNAWSEEGGYSGIIVGKKNSIQDLMWEEGSADEWHHRLEPLADPPTPIFTAPTGVPTSPNSSFAPIS
jgi:hypothetical protein